jgi:hypothetical protein
MEAKSGFPFRPQAGDVCVGTTACQRATLGHEGGIRRNCARHIRRVDILQTRLGSGGRAKL